MRPHNLTLLLLILLVSCTRYGLKHDNVRQHSSPSIELPSSLPITLEELESFFKNRGLVYSKHESPTRKHIDLEVDWVRDSNLEFYYIATSQRRPHLSHWKMVWRLTEISRNKTALEIESMELLFMGPQSEADANPNLSGQWVETPQTHLRAWLELRRFYTHHYPSMPVSGDMTLLRVPSMDFPPLSQENFRPIQLHRAERVVH